MIRLGRYAAPFALLPLCLLATAVPVSALAAAQPSSTPGVWRPQGVPGSIVPGDVSCGSATFCLLVGENAKERAATAAWNGQRWTPESVPTPDQQSLDGVSCVSKSFCEAVGLTQGQDRRMLFEQWNGKKWLSQPQSGQLDGGLADVSCVSSSFCVAVGGSADGSQSLAATYNGIRWTAKVLASGGDTLLGVSCASRGSCMAVGLRAGHSAVAEHLVSGRWTRTAVHSGHYGFDDVSCPTVNDCLAVGITNKGLGGFAERWANGAWHRQSIAGASNDHFWGISCIAADDCVIAGDSYVSATSSSPAAAEMWDGQGWTQQLVPVTGQGESESFSRISCVSGQVCEVVADGKYPAYGYER